MCHHLISILYPDFLICYLKIHPYRFVLNVETVDDGRFSSMFFQTNRY